MSNYESEEQLEIQVGEQIADILSEEASMSSKLVVIDMVLKEFKDQREDRDSSMMIPAFERDLTAPEEESHTSFPCNCVGQCVTLETSQVDRLRMIVREGVFITEASYAENVGVYTLVLSDGTARFIRVAAADPYTDDSQDVRDVDGCYQKCHLCPNLSLIHISEPTRPY